MQRITEWKREKKKKHSKVRRWNEEVLFKAWQFQCPWKYMKMIKKGVAFYIMKKQVS